jgi:hypothetical protein
MDNFNKEKIIGNIVGLNPTGTIDFNGTFQMNGNNNIIQTPVNASRESLEKSQNNEIICEKFISANYGKFLDNYSENEFDKQIHSFIATDFINQYNIIEKKKFNKKIILMVILFLLIFLIYILL